MNTRLYRPGQLIGHRRDGRPIRLLAGGSEMSVEPDGSAGSEDADDTGQADDGAAGAKYTPPTRADWLKQQTALVKANASAKARREALVERDKQIADLQAALAKREADDERRALLADQLPPDVGGGGRKSKKAAAAVPPPAKIPDDVLTKAQVRQLTAEAAREARAAAAQEAHSKVANQAARAALRGEGVSKEGAAKLVRLMNLADIEVDDDGEVIGGLDEQVEELKVDFPQLFKPAEAEKPKPKRTPVTKAATAGRQVAEEAPRTSAERMAAQILGSR